MNTTSHHPLNSKWVFWYHDPENTKWDIKSYQKIFSFDSVEKFWSLHKHIENEMINSGMFFIMKDGILPLWEDNSNINGGCWSYRIVKKDAYKAWVQLAVSLIGESLTSEDNFINGISISPKKGFCIIKIWNSDSNKKDISHISTDIPFFQGEEYIYKSFS